MKITFIYALKDPASLEVRYIGKANNPKSRYSRHINDAKNKPKCHRLCWIKGLLDNNKAPILEILEECDELIWGERENFWISKFDNLTNMIDGGKFCPMSNPEIVERMKKTKKENPQKCSEETRKKLSIHTKKLWDTGILKGKKQSKETKLKRAKSMSLAWNKRSKEEKERVGKLISKSKNKPVIQMDLNGTYIKEHPSAKIAEETLNISRDKVSLCCRGKRNSAGGFKWMLKSKYEASDENVVNQKMN